MNTFIVIKFRKEVYHSWDNAPEHRKYLRNLHRHMMHVKAKIQVFSYDREIEFHDFKAFCWSQFNYHCVPGMSCETMANELLAEIQERYGKSREAQVGVFEDGEVGAIVSYDLTDVEEYNHG